VSIDELAHSEDELARLRLERTVQGFAQMFADLLRALDSIEEGDGTVLDNTLVVWGSEVATAQHALEPMPFFLAGGLVERPLARRAFDVSGEPHAKLLVSIADALGVPLDGFGDVDPATGPLPGL
jgi:hypothetical protein